MFCYNATTVDDGFELLLIEDNPIDHQCPVGTLQLTEAYSAPTLQQLQQDFLNLYMLGQQGVCWLMPLFTLKILINFHPFGCLDF